MYIMEYDEISCLALVIQVDGYFVAYRSPLGHWGRRLLSYDDDDVLITKYTLRASRVAFGASRNALKPNLV